MDLLVARPPNLRQLELAHEEAGESRRDGWSGEALEAKEGDERSGIGHLMEEFVGAMNQRAALKRVRQDKGGPVIDGVTVGEPVEHTKRNRGRVRAGNGCSMV